MSKCSLLICASCNHKYCEFCYNGSKYQEREYFVPEDETNGLTIVFDEKGEAHAFDESLCIYCADEETLEKVKEAVDKQCAKQPYDKVEGFGDRVMACPTCQKPVTNYWSPGTKPIHCQFCGQKLKWE